MFMLLERTPPMADIVFRLTAITISAIVLGHSIPRIYFALKTPKASLRR